MFSRAAATPVLFLLLLQLLLVLLGGNQPVHAGNVLDLPKYLGAVTLSQSLTTTEADCFQHIEISFTLDDDKCMFDLQVDHAAKLFCKDELLFANLETVAFKLLLVSGHHHLDLKLETAEQMQALKTDGLQVFELNEGVAPTLVHLYEFYREMFSAKSSVADHAAFLTKNAGFVFEPRSPDYIEFDESYLKNGDYLCIQKLDGNHGGGDTLVAFGTGGMSGHAAIVMEWTDGKMHVFESINNARGIQHNPFSEWIENARQEQWLVTILRLNETLSDQFNVTSALDFFRSVEGTPYGYQNFLFGWIDTAEDNFPPPLSAELLGVIMRIVGRISPKISNLMWGEAMNHRLGTEGLDIEQIFDRMTERNLTMEEVIPIPEQDSWTYSTGYSRVCSSFAVDVMKHANIFDVEFQATEVTPRDLFSMNIWADTWDMPAICISQQPQGGDHPKDSAAHTHSFCQVGGPYWHVLTGFNSFPRRDNMFERCGALPTQYTYTPAQC